MVSPCLQCGCRLEDLRIDAVQMGQQLPPGFPIHPGFEVDAVLQDIQNGLIGVPQPVRVPSIRRVDGPVAEGVVQIAHAQLDMLTDILLGVRRYQIGQPAEDVVRFMENLTDFTGVPVEKLSPSAEETTGFSASPSWASRPRYTSDHRPSAHRAPPSGRCRCSHPLPPAIAPLQADAKAGGLQGIPQEAYGPADILVYSHHSGSPGSSHPKYVV